MAAGFSVAARFSSSSAPRRRVHARARLDQLRASEDGTKSGSGCGGESASSSAASLGRAVRSQLNSAAQASPRALVSSVLITGNGDDVGSGVARARAVNGILPRGFAAIFPETTGAETIA